MASNRAATRRVEGMPRDQRGRASPPQPRESPGDSFWAVITGRSIEGDRFSWQRATPDGKGGLVIEPSPGGQLNAIELNDSREVSTMARVRMHRIGRDEAGNPRYGFVAPAKQEWQPVPNHDHRDNHNGGFAFSVYHPGTDLPQQPYAL
ncbi:hypothetical protein ACERK3_17705 [Phycisphaerales bacterium AB-hyl4]|uniref:Uncharacterized protein n=1 Tax=Natronomicrosphaera hydrolytica TaxID=3242702 RepID=A0ABV4U985_9BACT